MLKTPAKDLPKIKKAIEEKYRETSDPSELYDVLDDWNRKESFWLSRHEMVPDEEAREALIDAGML